MARTLPTLTVLLLSLLPGAAAVHAHHAGSMFDSDKTVTLQGTVREFQFTNPHCWIQLQVPGSSGTVEWSIEMGAPMHLMRSGWKRNTLKSGDKVTVVAHPLRDGGKGGQFVSLTDAAGKTLGAAP